MARVYIGGGSNRGDRLEYLLSARRILQEHLQELKVSPLYETAPRDYLDQDDFLNCVFSGTTALEPLAFLDNLQGIEARAGRIREGAIPKGPRVLDLDILLWQDRVIDHPRLTVPHPAMRERAFVLIPLLALEPELTDPTSGKPLAEYLAALEDQGVRKVDFSSWMC